VTRGSSLILRYRKIKGRNGFKNKYEKWNERIFSYQNANLNAWCQIHEYDNISENADGNGDPSRAYSSEDYLKITEEQLKAAAAQQQVPTPPPQEAEIEQEVQPPG
jgi:hypothetical protein